MPSAEATQVSLSRFCTLQVCPWTDSLSVVLKRQRERKREGGVGVRGQTERAHLPAESLQDTSAAAPLGAVEWLCGQRAANKDALISANSSCLIHSNSCH